MIFEAISPLLAGIIGGSALVSLIRGETQRRREKSIIRKNEEVQAELDIQDEEERTKRIAEGSRAALTARVARRRGIRPSPTSNFGMTRNLRDS